MILILRSLTQCRVQLLLVGCESDSFLDECFHRNDIYECNHLQFQATLLLALILPDHRHLKSCSKFGVKNT